MTRRVFRISDEHQSAEALATATPDTFSEYSIPEHIKDEDSAVYGRGMAFSGDWSADGTVSGVFRKYYNGIGYEYHLLTE